MPSQINMRFFLSWFAATAVASSLLGQGYSEPVVARMNMRFMVEDKVVDEIETGDLLTVLEEKGDSYLVLTLNGKRGLVKKVNALKLAESVEVYGELLKHDSKDGRLYTLRASAWWARGDEKQALADYDRAIQAGYREPDAYSSRGLFHAALGNHDKAIADYNMAIKLGAKGESTYINRAAVYMTQQKYDLAIKDYGEAIRINAKRPTTYEQRAVAWKLSGQPDKAIADFGEAIKLDPKYAPALMGRGFLWFQKDENEKAIADFSEVIKLEPKAALAYNNRGYNRQLLGDYKNALADYEQAIKLEPEYGLAHQNMAWLLATADDSKIRDGKKAIEAATRACKLDEYKNLGSLKALAAAFSEDGQYDKAIGWQEKVIELAGDEQKPFEREVLEMYRAHKPFRLVEAKAGSR